MSLPEMIASLIINGAYDNFVENETASIEVGKKSDLVVLEHNQIDILRFDIRHSAVRF